MNKTHDYTKRSLGHDFSITKAIDGGMKVRVMGWGGGIKKGDLIVLANNKSPVVDLHIE